MTNNLEMVLTPMKVSVVVETRKHEHGAFVTREHDVFEHLLPNDCQTRTYAAPKDKLSRITVLSRRKEWQPDVDSQKPQTFVCGPQATPVKITYARVSDETVHISAERKYA